MSSYLRVLRLLPFLLIGICAATQPLSAQALKNPDVEGVLFIKRHSFTDASSGAWPVEYCNAASNERIIVITTRDGQQMRLKVEQVPDIIPYPGRGGLSRTEGLVLCELALKHYPQHRLLLTNVRNAWRRMSSADFEKYSKASEDRNRQADQVIRHMETESARITSHRISGAWIPSATLLDGRSKVQESPHQSTSAEPSQTDEPDNEEIRELQRQLEELLGR